jgi:hypothetical protein
MRSSPLAEMQQRNDWLYQQFKEMQGEHQRLVECMQCAFISHASARLTGTARMAARMNLEPAEYVEEVSLESQKHACFMIAPLKMIVARGSPIAKKHRRVRFKMSGQKPVTCDRLGLLPN